MAMAMGYSFNPSKLSDQELNEYLNFYRTGAARDNPANPSSKITLDLISRLEEEINARRVAKQQADQKAELEAMFSGAGVTQPAQVDTSLDDYAARVRSVLDEMFQAGSEQGRINLDDAFNAERGRVLDEAAAMGTLRQPGFITSRLNDMDALKQKLLKDLFLSLYTERARGGVGLETDIADRRERQIERQQNLALQKANLLQGGSQFGQTLGFERDKFSEAKKRSALDDIFNDRSLDLAAQVGRAQAEASKPSALGQIASIVGGVGGLAGGLGGLFGGLGAAKTAGIFARKPVV